MTSRGLLVKIARLVVVTVLLVLLSLLLASRGLFVGIVLLVVARVLLVRPSLLLAMPSRNNVPRLRLLALLALVLALLVVLGIHSAAPALTPGLLLVRLPLEVVVLGLLVLPPGLR